MVAKVLPSVVNIRTAGFNGDRGEASGVVIDRDGVIVTNFHVVRGIYSGTPELKHSVFGARDGSGVFNMRDTVLTDCSVVSPDVAVGKQVVGPPEEAKAKR